VEVPTPARIGPAVTETRERHHAFSHANSLSHPPPIKRPPPPAVKTPEQPPPTRPISSPTTPQGHQIAPSNQDAVIVNVVSPAALPTTTSQPPPAPTERSRSPARGKNKTGAFPLDGGGGGQVAGPLFWSPAPASLVIPFPPPFYYYYYYLRRSIKPVNTQRNMLNHRLSENSSNPKSLPLIRSADRD
jgi:hypothetical protein